MIKLTEIYAHPKAYDPYEEKISSSYGLREIYINPQFIIYVKEDEVMTKKAKNNLLVRGLHTNSQIANVYVSLGTGAEKLFNVVGAPKTIISNISPAA